MLNDPTSIPRTENFLRTLVFVVIAVTVTVLLPGVTQAQSEAVSRQAAVTGVVPADKSQNVDPKQSVLIRFSDEVDAGRARAQFSLYQWRKSRHSAKLKLRKMRRFSVPVSYGSTRSELSIFPSSGFEASSVYRLKLSKVSDSSGKKLRTIELEFTTGAGTIPPTPTPTPQPSAQPTPTPTPPPVPSGVLAPQDFNYLGYYDMQTYGLDSPFFQGLTHRYVNNDLRLLTYHHWGRLFEISLAGKNFGDTITSTTNSWDLQNVGTWDYVGLWWEASTSRLWTATSQDYTVTNYPVQLFTRKLNDNGSVSDVHGPVGLQGVPAKRLYGGVQAVPQWFQQQYNVAPYIAGWGGYTSLVMQGGGASMGPTMYSLPDISAYANNSSIPDTNFKTIMDSGGAPAQDWYPLGNPSAYDRGTRLTTPTNYYDGGDTRPNGSCPTCNATIPTVPPLSSAQWLSPAPDGYGRWIWGDSNYNTGLWIELPKKHGFITIASLGGGKAWYCASSLCTEKRQYEMHIWDPAELGAAALGQIPKWNVKPTSMQELTLPGAGAGGGTGVTHMAVAGATFDAATNRLYLFVPGVGGYNCRIYVYQVKSE
ncbi:MAG: Ig-like domain-containing protein [Bdellovibrionota bacterium]